MMKKTPFSLATLSLMLASATALADDYLCTASACYTIDIQHRVYSLPKNTVVSTNTGLMLQRDTGWQAMSSVLSAEANAASHPGTPNNAQ